METVLNTALVNKINTDVEAGFKQDEDVIIPEEVSSISGVSKKSNGRTVITVIVKAAALKNVAVFIWPLGMK